MIFSATLRRQIGGLLVNLGEGGPLGGFDFLGGAFLGLLGLLLGFHADVGGDASRRRRPLGEDVADLLLGRRQLRDRIARGSPRLLRRAASASAMSLRMRASRALRPARTFFQAVS